ncbi:MAG: dipeptidyl peptidase 3 [Bacteroidetes bacterium]|nr:dipeptidyl peptidase 3 [Bacteroidota bacterium]
MRQVSIVLCLLAVIMIACNSTTVPVAEAPLTDSATVEKDTFRFVIEQFADIKIMRYKVPGFEELTLQQKKLVYYLSRAALFGRDITFDQNYKHNLCIRRTLEEIYKHYEGDRTVEEFAKFMEYLKRVWFSNGIHHHYSAEKFLPEFPKEYFITLTANSEGASFPLQEGETIEELTDKLIPLLFDPSVDAKRIVKNPGEDLAAASANNFYEGVTQAEVDSYYNAVRDEKNQHPVSYGLNSKVVKSEGKVTEKVWKSGGMYGAAIDKIIYCLEKAVEVAENEQQKAYILKLIEYYKTGDLKTWDAYNVAWVEETGSLVDFVNGFIETYGDPFSMKATWEAVVNFKDTEATKRATVISENAQWFEDNSPVEPRFKKEKVRGVSAKVITVAQLGGDCYPSTPIGINLPNADWIRKEHGSKSVTMENITYAYDRANLGSGFMEEFAWSKKEIDRAKKFGPIAGNLHTDMHECVGHGSGQLLPGVSSEALKNYHSTLEEARADLFALYYMMDKKMIELGLMPTLDIARAEYDSYISNGIFWQLKRVKPGSNIEQDHMRNRQLIASWCYEKGLPDSVIIKKVKGGKTFFVINDYEKLRTLFGTLLCEVQRIKSEGDYKAGKQLVEDYAVKVDRKLHTEMLDRYRKLNLAPYGGFINPVLTPVLQNDTIVDVKIDFPDSFIDQMMLYSTEYSPLPVYN